MILPGATSDIFEEYSKHKYIKNLVKTLNNLSSDDANYCVVVRKAVHDSEVRGKSN